MKTNIFFLGLNRVSVSLGLAMKKSLDLIERTGFDPDISAIRKSNESGAIDKTCETMSNGVKAATVILYSLPAGQLMKVIKAIRPEMKADCVFIDLNPIGHDTFNQVSQLLPDPTRFISWVPALNPQFMTEEDHGPDGAKEDLFLNSQVFIAADISTRPEVLKFGSDLAVLSGCSPLFTTPDELAGIFALSQEFPRLIAAVIIRMSTSEPGWVEARKAAGFDFHNISAAAISYEKESLPEVPLFANRRNIQRLLVLLIQELQDLHNALETDNNPEVGNLIKNALVARQVWFKQRQEMSWREKGPINPDAPHSITEMMFGKHPKKR